MALPNTYHVLESPKTTHFLPSKLHKRLWTMSAKFCLKSWKPGDLTNLQGISLINVLASHLGKALRMQKIQGVSLTWQMYLDGGLSLKWKLMSQQVLALLLCQARQQPKVVQIIHQKLCIVLGSLQSIWQVVFFLQCWRWMLFLLMTWWMWYTCKKQEWILLFPRVNNSTSIPLNRVERGLPAPQITHSKKKLSMTLVIQYFTNLTFSIPFFMLEVILYFPQ